MPPRLLILISLLFSLNAFSDEEKPVKDPKVIFDSETDAALFKSIKGAWNSYKFEGEDMIRLSPEPIEHSRIDLGPLLPTYDITVSAKVLAKQKGRLKPRMGIGIFGDYGFNLRLAPGRKMLELVQYGEVIAETPCDWSSSQWQFLQLTLQAHKTYWLLEGTTWNSNQERPEKPTLVHRAYPATMTHSLYGRAFLTGSPYNSYPIFFDEVQVRKN